MLSLKNVLKQKLSLPTTQVYIFEHLNTDQHMSLTSSQYNQLIAMLNKETFHDAGDKSVPGFLSANMACNDHLASIASCFLSSCNKIQWIIDSGASDHITPHLTSFSTYKPINKSCFITIPNGQKASVLHIGNVILQNGIELLDVLHVPDFHYNLLSVQKLVSHYFVPLSFIQLIVLSRIL
ncbi:unnamed protein product [Cuscuta campestris]|uniref:Retrovirus-related Pol polyprotein from transposon TNT 1-94-like beta-barrel domain-containing protein n=1 Tax=Cuscuta campestris TaxID=132261 RepID=A0A484NJI7_9ASTE|nr:unnamed protein product [Cuscuta campestris]